MLYIDITRIFNHYRNKVGHLTGVDKVTLAYVRELGRFSQAVIRYPTYWLFLPYQLSQLVFEGFLTGDEFSFNPNCYTKWLNKFRYGKPKKRGLDNNYLLHTYHGGLEKAEFRTFMQQYGLTGIYFLHDLIPIDYPEYCRDGEKQKHQIRLETMSQGALVICNSDYTLLRWQDFCNENRLTLPTSISAHLAPDASWSIKSTALSEAFDRHLFNRPYFVMLGTIEGRKNHLLLLNIWRDLKKELQDACPKLVIIGKRGWECEQVLDILDRNDHLKGTVIEINNCSDKDLNYFLSHCQAMLFPSFEEGYGLPVVEAFRSGVPVIASDIPAFNEINFGDTACLLSPIDTLSWKHTILDYCDMNSPRRIEQLNKLEIIQPKLPNWHQHFDIVLPYLKQYINLS